MLKSVLRGTAQTVKFFLALFDYRHLGFEILAGLLVFVAGTGVFALLLVELCLTLFEFGLFALYTRKALVGLLFGFSLDFQLLFTSFEKLVFHDDLGFTVGIVDYSLGARAGCGTLHSDQYRNSDGRSDERRTNVE